MKRSTALLSLIFLMPSLQGQPAPSWPADASAYRFHMIGQAHIDPVWLWPWSEGLSVVHSTFRSALDRMKETPDFAFTASSAQFYQWVAENDPAMLAEIRARVEEGRWAVVGGWWVEPDVNLPNGEALVRQGLYGQLTLQRLLGRMAKTAYNPDSFGHPGTLPQILKLQGMNDYTFLRPEPNEKTLPGNLFWWEAPDGSRVLAYHIPYGYNDEGDVRSRLNRIMGDLKPPVKDVMAFYGAGDHGGGATKENIRSINQIRSEPAAPSVLYSTPDKYFAEVRETRLGNLPVIRDDLQHHAVGCYTAQSQIKKLNRTAELALMAAEKFAAIGSAAWGFAYPKNEFTAAWERVLFLQFHDSLAGSSLPEHYRTAAPEGYGYAMSVADRVVTMAAQKLAWEISTTDPDSKYLVIFNPNAWDAVRDIEFDVGFPAPVTVEDESGKAVPHQSNHASSEVNNRQRLIARVPVPALGYRQIRIRKLSAAEASGESAPAVKAEGRTLENEHLRITFDADGGVSLFDKDAGRELFAGAAGARALVLDDPSDTWSHNVVSYDREIGKFGAAAAEILENGPLRARMRVRSKYGSSSLAVDWVLYAGSRFAEMRLSLDWNEHSKIVKLSFPTGVQNPRPTYEIAYGHIVREPNGHEDPGQRWIDVSGTAPGIGDYGLSVINDAKYGYSILGNDLRVSIVRGAAYAHHIPHTVDSNDVDWQDQGIQTVRMWLVPHRGTWQQAGIQRMTEELTTPAPVIYQGIHGGQRAASGSFVAVDASNVVISAIKQAETDNDLIVRSYETAGVQTNASIDFRFAGLKWSGSFRPSEIKTLRVNLKTRSIREVNALEM